MRKKSKTKLLFMLLTLIVIALVFKSVENNIAGSDFFDSSATGQLSADGYMMSPPVCHRTDYLDTLTLCRRRLNNFVSSWNEEYNVPLTYYDCLRCYKREDDYNNHNLWGHTETCYVEIAVRDTDVINEPIKKELLNDYYNKWCSRTPTTTPSHPRPPKNFFMSLIQKMKNWIMNLFNQN